MFSGLFVRKKSVVDSSLLKGAVDNHSHILYGVDDGVKTLERSLDILGWLEAQGLKELWLTPHIMEDVPNTTAHLKERYSILRKAYTGKIVLHLSAEYMMDNLFLDRLEEKDLLLHDHDWVLMETSAIAPPLDLWGMLERTMSAGYRPLIAHPERYVYMDRKDYARLRDMGALFQLNLPSIVGYYGEQARARAEYLLENGYYHMTGSDCHRYHSIQKQYGEKVLSKSTIAALRQLMTPGSEFDV